MLTHMALRASPQRRSIRRVACLAVACAIATLVATPATAGTTSYTYDALGRLTKVTRPDGVQTIYGLDAAGNRTQVLESTPPTAPASITVPASSTTGSYTIVWTAPTTGTVTSYDLYESTSSSFASQTRIYSGAARSKAISGKSNGTYYYRVRACGVSCSGYRTGANAALVTLPPGVPASITVPSSSSTGSYTISWGASTGNVTAYELYEATNSSFSGQVNVYSGTVRSKALSGKGNGTYYYRVRACNGSACSGYRAGTNATMVTLPPSVPPSIAVSSSSGTGSYTISWASSTGNVTAYQLYEATNSSFSSQVNVYSGTGASAALAGRGNGTYYYRVRACNGSVCSGYRTGANATTVTLPPGIPPSISVPTSSTTGNYTISWGASTGNVTTYAVDEATDPTFSSPRFGFNVSGTSAAISGRSSGFYFYRVRACNGSACSGYRTSSHGVGVTLPPSVPSSISVPSSSSTGSYTISWGASTGNVSAYQLYEATNSSFSGQVQVYSGTGASRAISGKQNGTYYYRVRACFGSACSSYRAGANAVSVTLAPPAAPSSISGPTHSTGNYSISWASSAGAARYELWENDYGSPFSKVYDGPSTFHGFNNKPAGEYSYKARACNSAGCGAYSSTTRLVLVCNPVCN